MPGCPTRSWSARGSPVACCDCRSVWRTRRTSSPTSIRRSPSDLLDRRKRRLPLPFLVGLTLLQEDGRHLAQLGMHDARLERAELADELLDRHDRFRHGPMAAGVADIGEPP